MRARLRFRHLVEFALAVLCALVLAPLHAQPYPTRPVRLVVPYPPGGANDTVARLIAPGLGEQLGRQIVVDNRGGANTIIGSELVANAAPDGHTLLIIAAGHAINPALYRKLPYDTARDFAPVVLIGDGAYVLVAHPSLAVASVAELIAVAKAKPGQIAYASSSVGNFTHLAAELFNALAGVKMLHVPYKGGGPAMTDLLGGRVSVFFSTVAVARPHLQSGKIRGLGVTTARRSAALPNLPTISESGLPGYAASGWYGLVAPAATPKHIVNRVNAETRRVVQQTDIREKLLASGVDAVDAPVEQFSKLIAEELARWSKVVKSLAITPE